MASRSQSNIAPMLRSWPAHLLDVGHGPGVGMDAALDGRVLGRQAKGVKAHGEQDVVAPHAHEARPDIGGRHGVPVADVQVATGVGQHGQGIVLGLVGINDGAVEVVSLPARLPLGFDLLRECICRPYVFSSTVRATVCRSAWLSSCLMALAPQLHPDRLSCTVYGPSHDRTTEHA